MNLPTWYDAGTVSVAGGSTTVTGTGTLWGGDAIMVGDLFCDLAQPLVPPQRVASVTDDGSLELASPWPGADMTDATYEIRYVGIIERSTAQSRKVLEQLGDVKAWYDVVVADEAARLALETTSNPLRANYRVMVEDPGVIWAKQTAAYGDWIGPVEFRGEKGDKGDTGDQGPTGRGPTPKGTYNPATAYVLDDAVLDNGSSWIALGPTTGNAPPVLPATSNAYWQLMARKGTDGTGTGDVVGPAGAVDNGMVAFDGNTGKLTKMANPAVSRGILQVLGLDDSYVPLLTGGGDLATLRTILEERLVLPEMFATAGQTDWKTPIQKAMDNSNGAEVRLLPKQYNVSDTLFYPSGLKMRGASKYHTYLRPTHNGRALAAAGQAGAATQFCDIRDFWIYGNPSSPVTGSVGVELRNSKHCVFDLAVSGFALGVEHYGDATVGSFYNRGEWVVASCTTGYQAFGLTNTNKWLSLHFGDVGTGMIISAGNGSHFGHISIEQAGVGIDFNGPATDNVFFVDRLESSLGGAIGIRNQVGSGAVRNDIVGLYMSTMASPVVDTGQLLSFNGFRPIVTNIPAATHTVPANSSLQVPVSVSGLSVDAQGAFASRPYNLPVSIVGPEPLVGAATLYLSFSNLTGAGVALPAMPVTTYIRNKRGAA